MPRKNGEIRPSNVIRAGRGANGGPHLVSVLREGRKSVNIRCSSGVIRGIPGNRIFPSRLCELLHIETQRGQYIIRNTKL